MYVDMPLALYASAPKISVKKSTKPHPVAELGSFATKTIEEGEVVRHYYGSLVYSDLIEEQQTITMYKGRDAGDFQNFLQIG